MNGNFDISRFKQSLIDALTESLKNQGADEAKRYATELETREAELAGVRPQVRESLMGRRGASIAEALSKARSLQSSGFSAVTSVLSQLIQEEARRAKEAEKAAQPKKLTATEINMGPYIKFRGQYPDAYLKWLWEKHLGEGSAELLDPSKYYQEYYKQKGQKEKESPWAGLLKEEEERQAEVQSDIDKLRAEGYSDDEIYDAIKQMSLRPEDYGIKKKPNLIPDWIPMIGRF